MYKRISYLIKETDAKWPGNPGISFTPYEDMSKGDVVNTYNMQLFNHNGSHMDAPRHFINGGLKISELPMERFIYEKPLLLDIAKSFGELVTIEDLEPFEDEIKAADLLMIRSGFSVNRSTQPDRYSSEGPGISSKAARYMIENFGNLKAVALDWISLASYQNIPDGLLAHQLVLGKYNDNFICVIEDLNFEGLEKDKIKRVLSMPLFVEEIDSSPVTVIAELEG